MASLIKFSKHWLLRTVPCLFFATAMTGCSAFQTSHFIEPDMEMSVSPQAIASADDVFIAEPFSLVAADSIGLATFGFEIAQWAEMQPAEQLAKND
ncbi:MAG: hypothetical protein AB8C95_07075 [Phycisphaeraceae bacterium]